MMWKVNRNALAYSATTAAAAMMNSVFQFYYVKLFLNHYGISTYWFNTAQILYLLWNAINDPLFGYFQDYSKITCLKHRQLNILYGAPIFAITFLLPWFSWVRGGGGWLVGLHLIVSLCLYDCLLTFVLLAQCSLFTESSRNEGDRQANLIYSQVATLVGASSVFFCELISKQMADIPALQMCCVAIAIISTLLMRYTANNITVAVDRTEEEPEATTGGWRFGLKTSLEILKNRNFISFVMMNFLQIFHQTVCANFFSIFREGLIGTQGLPGLLQSALAGSAFMLPPITVLLFNPVLRRSGSYVLIKYSFIVKVVTAFLLFNAGSSSPSLLGLFMVIDSTLATACFSLFNLSVSHIIDEDQAHYQRIHPVSSMVFGLNALFTKPAQSFAPMVVVYILKMYGYDADMPGLKNGRSGVVGEGVRECMFYILVTVPLVVGILQLLVWSIFTLRGKDGGSKQSRQIQVT